MAFQSYCYLRQGFIIVPQQMSVSKWHQLTNYKSPRLICSCSGSGWGLLHISAISKPPKQFSKQQENSPFGILLPFFMKWFHFANKGLLGQLNLCLCVSLISAGWYRDVTLPMPVAMHVCCVGVAKRRAVPVERHSHYFWNQLDQNVFALLIRAFDFQLPPRKKNFQFTSYPKVYPKAAQWADLMLEWSIVSLCMLAKESRWSSMSSVASAMQKLLPCCINMTWIFHTNKDHTLYS